MSLRELFSQQFLFEINRIQILPIDKLFLLIGAVAFVVAVILKLGAKYAPSPADGKYRNKLFSAFLFLSLAEIIWYGSRLQFVRLLGTHFVAIAIIIIFLWWLLSIAWKMFRNYRNEKTVWEKEQVRMKYLQNYRK